MKAAVDARVCRPAVVLKLNMRERYTLALSMRELRRGVPRLFAGADRKRQGRDSKGAWTLRYPRAIGPHRLAWRMAQEMNDSTDDGKHHSDPVQPY